MAGGMKLQSAATSGNGNEVNCRGIGGTYTLTVIGTGTISAGEVQWEESPIAGYSGTWRALGTAIAPAADTVVAQNYNGPLSNVRARISTNITGGGSVTVRMQTPNEWQGGE